MDQTTFGALAKKYVNVWVLLGLMGGIILFFLILRGIDIPVSIGTKEYHGFEAALLLLIALPAALGAFGLAAAFIVYIFLQKRN